MRVDDLRSELLEAARSQPGADLDHGRRAVTERVRSHHRRSLVMSTAALLLVIVFATFTVRAGAVRDPNNDLGVTSGVGEVPRLVPSFVPGDLTPSHETLDFAGKDLDVAGGTLQRIKGPGYSIAWERDATDGESSPVMFMTVSSGVIEDEQSYRSRHPDAISVDVDGATGLLDQLPDPHPGWFVAWPLEGTFVVMAMPCVDCPSDELLRAARSVHPVDRSEWQRFLSGEPRTTTTSTRD